MSIIIKKTLPQKETNQKDKNTIVETIRKSQLAASNEFEIKKFSRMQEGFLQCSIEEEKESLVIRYDIHSTLPWPNILKEKRKLMISVPITAEKDWTFVKY